MRFAYGTFVMVLSFAGAGEDEPRLDPIAKDQYPALVFVQPHISTEGVARDQESLMVATFAGGTPAVKNVLTSQSITAEQLADSVFLLGCGCRPEDPSPWTWSYFLVDFRTGAHVLMFRSKSRDKTVHFQRLRSVLDRGEAMVVRYGPETGEEALITVDLKTLEATPRYTLPKTEATNGFHNSQIGISPDFRLLATMIEDGKRYVPPQVEPVVFGRFSYSLCVLDLETMNTVTLDDNVVVVETPFFSCGPGSPPFEWISDQEILYQHMIPADEDEEGSSLPSQRVLKCVNIETKEISEWHRERVPVVVLAGNMYRDCFTEELRYLYFTVDTRTHSVRQYHRCYSVKYGAEGEEIWFRGALLHFQRGQRVYVDACPSHSQEHVAFFIRPYSDRENTLTPTVYAQTKDMGQAVKVAEVSFFTRLVSWIEETSTLRGKQSSNGMESVGQTMRVHSPLILGVGLGAWTTTSKQATVP